MVGSAKTGSQTLPANKRDLRLVLRKHCYSESPIFFNIVQLKFTSIERGEREKQSTIAKVSEEDLLPGPLSRERYI